MPDPSIQPELLDQIQQLLDAEDHNPLRLLEVVQPHLTPRTARLWRDLRRMAARAGRTRQALVNLLDQLGRTPAERPFNQDAQLAGYLNLESLLPGVVGQLEQEVELLAKIAEQAADVPRISRLINPLLEERRNELEVIRSRAAELGIEPGQTPGGPQPGKVLKPGDNPAQFI